MKKVIALACLSMLPMSYAAAEGYQVNAQSTKQAGMGHVGVAMKLGAESMHFNPAGLVFMDKNVDLSAGITGVFAMVSLREMMVMYKKRIIRQVLLYMYMPVSRFMTSWQPVSV